MNPLQLNTLFGRVWFVFIAAKAVLGVGFGLLT